MKRSELKQLVKECLIEVLQEGLGPISGRQQPSRPLVSDSSSRSSLRATMAREQAQARRPRQYDPRLDERVGVKSTANLLTSNPVMASIFEDTAQSTLLEQDESAGGYTPSGGDAAGMTVAQHAPEEMFDGADRWSALAFAKPAKKTSDAPVHASPSGGSQFSVSDDDDDPFADVR